VEHRAVLHAAAAVDSWTILFWRGLFAGLFLAGFIALQERRRVGMAIRVIGIEGLLVALCSALATVCFLNAMRLTSVADVMVIDPSSEFFKAMRGNVAPVPTTPATGKK